MVQDLACLRADVRAAWLFDAGPVENGGAIIFSLILQLTLKAPHIEQHVSSRLLTFVRILGESLVDDPFELFRDVLNKLC